MKKISTLLASLPLITTACGGGGGDGSSSSSTSQASVASINLTPLKGIWSETGTQTYTSPSGKTTTFQAPTALITSQEDMIILTGESELYIIKAGTNTAHYFISFAYSTEITPQTSLSNNVFNFNYYNPKREANGSVNITGDGHYDVAMDLSSMNGTWTDEYNNNAAWVFTTLTDGTFSVINGACDANGTLSNIDPSKKELAVSITFGVNCGANLKNTHTGFAWPDEGEPNNVLNMAVYSSLDVSGKAIGWKLRR